MTDQTSEQSSGFWTLTRPKLAKRRNSDLHELHHKVFNICVVGLSGTEKDKGPIGIGKSCLCNRFVRSAADDYFTDHISILSQSDFSGHVVNNDHWLYWGSVIKSCDGCDLAFNVIEQTEFVDDVCFQPLKSGKTDPYYKRCANTKLISAEKLMYICKGQLGVEREYEQRFLPDGKFNVDGFLCLFDVSEVHGRDMDKQIELTNLILLNLVKTRKPVVFVTTKHDEANELLLLEAERLVNQRDFRGLVPIVETSAKDNVNINMAFLICAQLIDKSRAKLRVPPYFEAYRSHLELLKVANDAYLGLIRSTVHDYRSSWQQVCIKLSHNPEFLQYTYLHGLDRAALVFKEHVKRLHEGYINKKVQTYLKLLPDALEEILSRNCFNNSNNNVINPAQLAHLDRLNSSSSIETWAEVKEYIKKHPSFNRFFVRLPDNVGWHDTDSLQGAENRIPFDWLNSNEAYATFQQRNRHLEVEQRRNFAKEIFARMLIDLKVPVGKPFVDLDHILANTPELESLNEQELFEIYVAHQNNLLQKARADFQELLLENAEHLHHLTSSDKVIRQEDIKTINAILQHDDRYQALDRFDQDRTLMMIRHLSFLHSQISEQCPSHPQCVEPEVERLLITKAKALVNRFYENKPDNQAYLQSLRTCDLVIFGPRRPSQQLILALNVLNSRASRNSQHQITFTVFDNCDDIDAQIQRFRHSNTNPKGCFGIFTNARSLDQVSFTLEKFLLVKNSQSQTEKEYFGGPPIVMLYAADITLDERTMLTLENEGQQMADRFKCPFMNVTAIDQYRQHQQNNILNNEQDSTSQVMSECASLDYACVDAAFNVLKEAISRRMCFMELYNNQDLIPRQAFNPDARILMCLLCGEPFSNERFLWRMFLESEDCYVTSSKSICLRIKSEKGHERFLEVTITSYTHGAFNYKEDLLHGFILACSMQRRASVSVMNAFSFNIPCTPVLVVAVNSENRSIQEPYASRGIRQENNEIDNDENDFDFLTREARATSDRLKGDFELLQLTSDEDQAGHLDNSTIGESKRFENFIRNVFRRKPAIDKAYQLDDDEPRASLSLSKSVQSGFQSCIKLHRTIEQHNNQQKLRTPREIPKLSSEDDEDDCDDDTEIESQQRDGALKLDASIKNHHYELGSPSAMDLKDIQQESLFKSTFKQLHSSYLPPLQQHHHSNRPLPSNRKFIGKDRPIDTDVNKVVSNQVAATGVSDAAPHLLKRHDPTRKLPPLPIVADQTQLPTSSNIRRMIASVADQNHNANDLSSDGDDDEDIENEDAIDEEEDGATTEDSTDNKFDCKQKRPGKLDLRQFDNITTAIGKLNVQPPSVSPTSLASAAQTTTTTISHSTSKNSKSSKHNQQPQSNDSQTPNSRRLNNLRLGRAVAPPKLPANLLFKYSSGRSGGNDTSSQTKISQQDEESGAIDFSQSPIAQRLLKHSKNHKVSELNSPYGSDSEHQQQASGYVAKAQGLIKAGSKSDKSNFNRVASLDSSELISSRGETIRQLNEILAKKPPGQVGASRTKLSRGSSTDQLVDEISTGVIPSSKKDEKDTKKDKKKLRSDEKLEKRKQKEEERLRRQEEEKLRRQEKKLASKKTKPGGLNSNSLGDDGVPLFIKCCIEFIESEGLDAEGIYRVPGNRAHVDAFVQKFKENPEMSILESDIPVNAVATALKDFLSKKWGPIIPSNLMNELTELSSITDKNKRKEAIKDLIDRLPTANYKVLKYVFSHFVKVTSNNTLNSMDSKNLAICWWPTLLPLHFSDMVMFEQMRPHLEESIQTMIDQYDSIFDRNESSHAMT